MISRDPQTDPTRPPATSSLRHSCLSLLDHDDILSYHANPGLYSTRDLAALFSCVIRVLPRARRCEYTFALEYVVTTYASFPAV